MNEIETTVLDVNRNCIILRYTDSDCPFGIFKPFLHHKRLNRNSKVKNNLIYNTSVKENVKCKLYITKKTYKAWNVASIKEYPIPLYEYKLIFQTKDLMKVIRYILNGVRYKYMIKMCIYRLVFNSSVNWVSLNIIEKLYILI